MTLKQFFQVAGGALIALLIYSSGLPAYVKWPLIVISFLFGVALAFFPLEDRPLSKWIYLFIKAIYSPTIYVWKQVRQAPYFAPEEATAPAPQEQKPEAPSSTAQPELTPVPETQKLEEEEEEFLSKVVQQFSSPTSVIKGETFTQKAPAREVSPQTTRQEVEVPEGQAVRVEPIQKEVPVVRESAQQAPSVPTEVTAFPGGQISTQQAQFSDEAAPPTPPTKPNVIVGQAIDADKKIIDGAILEIKDSEGRPVRALKSNKLGHFMIVTPLANGKYEIITDKEGYEFEPVTLEAQGQIIPPIAIKAKSVEEQKN